MLKMSAAILNTKQTDTILGMAVLSSARKNLPLMMLNLTQMLTR
jgi:hypothetical protein